MNKFQKYGIAALTVLIIGVGAASVFATTDVKKTPAAPATAAAAPSAPAAVAAKTADANPVIDKGWTVRCPDKAKTVDKKNCEVFTRLEMKATSMRVAEFAVGFPQDKTLPKGTARGVIILPLGILLLPGNTSMKIDDGKAFAFNSRFCTNEGCFASVDMGNEILDAMKKGKSINLFFKTSDGRDARATIDLGSFAKALSNIQ